MQKAKEHRIVSSRVHTTHGRKKNQGLLAIVNNKPSLCFTDGNADGVIGYTPLEDIMRASYTIDLPVLTLDF